MFVQICCEMPLTLIVAGSMTLTVTVPLPDRTGVPVSDVLMFKRVARTRSSARKRWYVDAQDARRGIDAEQTPRPCRP